MPTWVPITIMLTHAGVVVVLALAAVFSETSERRDAAYRVLLPLLPWGVVTIVAEVMIARFLPPVA